MVSAEFIDKIFIQFLPKLSEKYTVRKLSLLTKSSYDATYRHVHYLIKENALKVEKVGAYSYVSVNFESNLARKIIEKVSLSKTEIFLKKDIITKKLLEELIKQFKDALPNELLSMILYGSYARGTQTEQSDIDLLIVVSTFDTRDKIERICDATEMRYGKDIAPLITTATELRKMLKSETPTVAQEILLDGVVLFGFEKYYSIIFEAIE
jgi:predicted nucleotidyltransferase